MNKKEDKLIKIVLKRAYERNKIWREIKEMIKWIN